MNTRRLLSLSKKVLHPEPKCSSMTDMAEALDRWELDLIDYERITHSRVSDLEKMAALIQLMPEKYATIVQDQPDMETYEKVRAYVDAQVVVHLGAIARKAPSQSAKEKVKKDNDKMDLGDCEEEESMDAHGWEEPGGYMLWEARLRPATGAASQDICGGPATTWRSTRSCTGSRSGGRTHRSSRNGGSSAGRATARAKAARTARKEHRRAPQKAACSRAEKESRREMEREKAPSAMEEKEGTHMASTTGPGMTDGRKVESASQSS